METLENHSCGENFGGDGMEYRYDKVYKGVVCQPNCADEWLELIWEVGIGYDGCYTAQSLMELVDELIDYSKKARKCLYDGNLFTNKEESERSHMVAMAEQANDKGG